MKKQSIEKKIRKRMMQIVPPDRAYFMKSESAIRLCHIENGKFKYIVFPFCDLTHMLTAAALLKDCGFVEGYKPVVINDRHFYVELFELSAPRVHKDAKGKKMKYRARKVIEWEDLKLTRYDVQQFIAHFEFYTPAHSTAPIIPIYRNKQNAA